MGQVGTHHDTESKTLIGFWMYLMTDAVLFAALFATFAILRRETFGGPGIQDVFTYRHILVETIVLLTASFSAGPVFLAVAKKQKGMALFWLSITFFLGALFLWMQVTDFKDLLAKGMSWKKSAFLSGYFTLVGTHGLHLVFGLIWTAVLAVQLGAWGFHPILPKRFMCLKLFWQFVYFVWIFVFTFVYLMSWYG